MRDGGREFDVTHPLAAHLALGDFHAALLADDALIADPLIPAAMALPVAGGSEDPLAEESVALGFLSAVVYGLGLGHLAVGPLSDLFGRCDADLYCVEIAEFVHIGPPYSSSSASSFMPKMSKALPVPAPVSALKMSSSSSAPVSNMLSMPELSLPSPSKRPSPRMSTSLSSS